MDDNSFPERVEHQGRGAPPAIHVQALSYESSYMKAPERYKWPVPLGLAGHGAVSRAHTVPVQC